MARTYAQTPGIYGRESRPTPRLIESRATRAPALAVSRGLDRDRAVDESGNQLAVFGRRGSGPVTLRRVGCERRSSSLRSAVP